MGDCTVELLRAQEEVTAEIIERRAALRFDASTTSGELLDLALVLREEDVVLGDLSSQLRERRDGSSPAE